MRSPVPLHSLSPFLVYLLQCLIFYYRFLHTIMLYPSHIYIQAYSTFCFPPTNGEIRMSNRLVMA